MKPTEFFVWATVYMLSVFSIFLFLIGVYWRSVFERLAAHRHRSWSWWSAFELFLKHEVQTWISRLLVIQVCCLNVINKFRIFLATVWKYLFPGRPCGRAIWWHDDPGDVWAPGAPSLLKVFLASVFALWFSFARCRKTNRIYAQSDPWGFPGQRADGDRLLWPQLPQEFQPSDLLSNTVSSKKALLEIRFCSCHFSCDVTGAGKPYPIE